MKTNNKFIFLISGFLIFFLSDPLFALDISINKASFQYKGTKYLEVYLQVLGNTVTFKETDTGLKTASVELTILIKKDSQIYNFEKYVLNSTLKEGSMDFIDVKRFKIENGTYELVVEASDLNLKENTFFTSFDFGVNFNTDICISDFQLLAKIEKRNESSNPFVKNGYYMEPTLFSFLPQNIDTLGVYFEIYNAQELPERSKIVLSINSGFRNTPVKELIVKEIPLKQGELIPVLTKMDIKGLPSGNYHLKADIIDRFGIKKLTSSVNFQRSNPGNTSESNTLTQDFENSFVHRLPQDSLLYALKAIVPLNEGVNLSGLIDIIKGKKYSEGRYFLWRYYFDKNKLNPEQAYLDYMKYAVAVDKTYRSQVGYGFETDRGYIYLKYGMPTDVVTRESEPTAPPYEIWFYDQIERGKQKKVKFIFYIPSLAHNDFELLHSTCIGEINNPNWFYDLYSKRSDSNITNLHPEQIKGFYNSLRNSFDSNAVKIWEEFR